MSSITLPETVVIGLSFSPTTSLFTRQRTSSTSRSLITVTLSPLSTVTPKTEQPFNCVDLLINYRKSFENNLKSYFIKILLTILVIY